MEVENIMQDLMRKHPGAQISSGSERSVDFY